MVGAVGEKHRRSPGSRLLRCSSLGLSSKMYLGATGLSVVKTRLLDQFGQKLRGNRCELLSPTPLQTSDSGYGLPCGLPQILVGTG